MYRLHIHLPDELKAQIAAVSMMTGEPKAEVARKALLTGLKGFERRESSSAAFLLKLADIAKKTPGKGPRDLSVNHDYYAWGGRKRVTHS